MSDRWERARRSGLSRLLVPPIQMWVRSWQVNLTGATDVLASRAPIVFAFWHGEMAALLGGVGQLGDRGLTMLQAPLPQARFVAEVVAPLGLRFIEAPTGGQALLRAARAMRDGMSVAVAVDGPVGPARHARSGASMLSRLTGAPVVPVRGHGSPAMTLTSFWDRAEVPYPCAAVTVELRPALSAPVDRADVKRHVATVQGSLN